MQRSGLWRRIRLLQPLPPATPATADQARFAPLDALLKDAVEKGNAPGAVLLVGHNGAVVYRKAYGNRALEPTKEAMTVDTVFDMASLTKVMATTTSVMRLVQLGQVKLNDPVAKYIPEFAQNGKDDVTVRQLLTHYSGLRADLDLKPYWSGVDEGLHARQCREADQSARLDFRVQRHQLRRAGRTGAAGRAACRSISTRRPISSARWA